jgi:hypothetical protein
MIESSSSTPKRLTPILDNLEKTYELMAILEAAVPFEVALLPDLIDNLARQQKPVVVKPIETVSGLSYLGDVGGISCHILPEDAESVVVVSLTHVRVRHTLPFCRARLSKASREETPQATTSPLTSGSSRPPRQHSSRPSLGFASESMLTKLAFFSERFFQKFAGSKCGSFIRTGAETQWQPE